MPLFLTLLSMMLVCGEAVAQAPRRVALVITNDAYVNAPPLANAARDGDLIATALGRQGYLVRRTRNATSGQLDQTLLDFRTVASGADVAVVYVAGHGLTENRKSRFVGVNAPRNLGTSAASYSTPVSAMLMAMSGARTRVVLFDACRNSPFAILRAPTPRGVGMGFTDEALLRDGAMLALSARIGAFAFDGPEGGNGPFATAIAARLATDVDDFPALLRHARADVAEETNGAQEPALFLPSPPRVPPAVTPPQGGDCPLCPQVSAAPPGVFQFGSPLTERGRDVDEAPPTTVRMAGFEITRTEITRSAFAAFVTATGRVMAAGCEARTGEGAVVSVTGAASWRAPGFEQTDAHPVVCVDWQDARDYAEWLSTQTGRRWRLPSEAEWEYAARAGAATPFFWGDDRVATCAYGNGDDQTAPVMAAAQCRDGYAFTAPAGAFKANGWGLFDTAGNVWEWTLDCDTGAVAPPALDGAPRTAGQCANRTIRGGSFDYGPNFLRSASRHRLPPDTRNASVGFRLVRER